MTTMLKDAPGGRDFINLLTNKIEDVAAEAIGRPDEEVRARLQVMNRNLKRDMAPLIGAHAAAEIADVFCAAIMGEKHEREALGMSRA